MTTSAARCSDADPKRPRTLTTTPCLIGELCGDRARGAPVLVTHWTDRHGAILIDSVQLGGAFADPHCFSDWQLADFVQQIRLQQQRSGTDCRHIQAPDTQAELRAAVRALVSGVAA